jgi:hypothetical protein
MTISSTSPPRRFSGRLLLALGLSLTVLGVLAYIVQLSTKRLLTPWYMPAATTLGAILLVASLWQRRTVWRVLALLLLLLLAGLEWAVFLAAQLPAYTGPLAEGKPFPAFTTMKADGSPFTQRDLEGEPSQVLVFFRGRW